MAPRDSEEIVRLVCPELEPAWASFDQGNFKAAKASLKAALGSCPEGRSVEVDTAARQLLFCMAPDPWTRRLAVGALVVLVVLVVNYVA